MACRLYLRHEVADNQAGPEVTMPVWLPLVGLVLFVVMVLTFKSFPFREMVESVLGGGLTSVVELLAWLGSAVYWVYVIYMTYFVK